MVVLLFLVESNGLCGCFIDGWFVFFLLVFCLSRC